MNRLTLTIEGMTCHHCEMTVEKAVKQLKNVYLPKLTIK
jgi:copper chaperone CopZ